jgi:hypothetical protein
MARSVQTRTPTTTRITCWSCLEDKLPLLLAAAPLPTVEREALVLFCACHDLRQREARRHEHEPMGPNATGAGVANDGHAVNASWKARVEASVPPGRCSVCVRFGRPEAGIIV